MDQQSNYMQHPRVQFFIKNAKSLGFSDDEINSQLQGVVIPKIQKMEQDDLIKQIQVKSALQSLNEKKLTPEEEARKKVEEARLTQEGYEKAGLNPEGKKATTEQTADEKKKKDEGETVTNIINTLAGSFAAIPQESKGPVQGRKSKLASIIGFDEPGANQIGAYEDARLGLAASIKAATGDTGVLTNSDRKYIASLLPSSASNPGRAKENIKLLDKFLADKYGKGLNPEILKSYGIGEDSNAQNKSAAASQNIQEPTTQTPTQKGQPLVKHSIGEAMQALVGTPKAREKFMNDFAQMLQLKGDMFGNKNNRGNIPVLDQVLSLSSGAAKGYGEGPIQAIGGLSSGNKYDVGMGAAKTGLEVIGGGKMKPGSTLVSMLLGGGLNALQNKDALQGAGEGLATASQFEGLSSLLGPITNRYVHPRAYHAGIRSKEAVKAAEKGVEFKVTKSMKEASKFIIDKADYIKPEEASVLKNILSQKVLTPTEANEALPILRKIGRSTANNPLRSGEAQAAEHLYSQILDQSKDLVPGMFKATESIAKTFPKQTKNLEPLQRLLYKGTQMGGAAAGGALLYSILNRMGVGGNGGEY